ncbi:unnamed protein product [Pocillopora meandrina]|uniref:THAP-type domain-containing protein n=1 Tax=Pocillopora meandrina TaxID=46732 RepID=A0AAU9XLJ7_9CNID|nr:unnamed protein product [Pocillopora meandrina]
MVHCFATGCDHHSESHTCKFYGFPHKIKKKEEYQRWIRLIRRKDREPGNHSRICSCHFRDGKNSAGPEIYTRNADKLFLSERLPRKRKKQSTTQSTSVHDMVQAIRAKEEEALPLQEKPLTSEIILEAELYLAKRELEAAQYQRTHYSASTLTTYVLRMETGLPTKEVFQIVVNYASRFKDSLSYYTGWRVESISFEDQILITLMKLRQNYTNLHIAQLFSCSVATISNVVTTFVHVLHNILFDDLMTNIPSREKNKLCSPSSFSMFTSCRIVIDCTDIEIAAPSLMSQQNTIYSNYRGMNSFKVIVGVAPNAVIMYVSKLYPGSISDKEIVKQSGLMNHIASDDLILADKEFLIQDIVFFWEHSSLLTEWKIHCQ